MKIFGDGAAVRMLRLQEIFGAIVAGRTSRIFLLAAPVALLVSLLAFSGIFSNIDLLLVDLRFQTREKICDPVVDPSIVTIDWDESTIQELGRWPWTWDRHAQLIRFLDLMEVRMIGISDDHFSEKNIVTMEVNDAYALAGALQTELTEGRAENVAQLLPRHMEEFCAAVREADNVFLCEDFSIPEEGADEHGAFEPAPPEIARFGIDAARAGGVIRASRIKPPIDPVAAAEKGAGFNRIMHDKDGVVRHTPAVIEYGGRLYPNLAVAMAAHRFGVTLDRIKVHPGKEILFEGARYPDGSEARIPIDERGMMALNWVGPYNYRIAHIPFLAVAEHHALTVAKSAAAAADPAAGRQGILEAGYAAALSTRLVTDEDAQRIAWAVLDGIVAEEMIRAGKTYEDFLASYLEGSDSSGIGRRRFNSVRINLRALDDLMNDAAPDYAAILSECAIEDTPYYRACYDQMLHMHRKAIFDQLAPPLFITSTLTDYRGWQHEWSPLEMKEKTVFIGLTATALHSLNPTPFEKRSQMFGIQPIAYNTIVSKSFIVETPRWAEFLIIVAASLVVTSLVLRFGTVLQALTTLSGIAAYVLLAWGSFARYGIVMPMASPLVAIALSHIGAVVFRYVEAQREKRKVRGFFSAMVSPMILRIMEEHPDKIRLLGERKDATMFSSDVSGFTTISEGVTAQELAGILNIYLTPMSNIIMKYDGFVDKFEGDAIKAEFGIPITDENHPWKGVFAALEQQEELAAVARMLLIKYGVKITARMGVNTGIISAGNMGSERRMQYTVMGEQVALAEELEPINKLYESWIAIGGETARRAANFIEARLLDVVELGASKEPVSVYEPLGWKKDAYTTYWRGRPVPPLFIENWRNMGPERALGYLHYYAGKSLPESPMRTELMNLFERVKADAIAAITNEDKLIVSALEQELRSLESLIAKFGGATAGTRGAAVDWEARITEWRERLLMARREYDRARGSMPKAESEEIQKILDTLEKRVECIRKRATFPAPSDVIASILAENLKKIISSEQRTLSDAAAAAARREAAEAAAKITAELSAFLDTLSTQARADAFHDFMADVCAVAEIKLRLREIYDRARAEYLKRNWDEAERLFREALELVPDDGPSMKYIERVAHLRKNPPPDDWDGVWRPE